MCFKTEVHGRENVQPYLRSSTLASEPQCVRRIIKEPCVSRVYTSGYNNQYVDNLSKTTPFPVAQHECYTPMVPIHDFVIPCTTTKTTGVIVPDTEPVTFVSRYSPTLTPPTVHY